MVSSDSVDENTPEVHYLLFKQTSRQTGIFIIDLIKVQSESRAGGQGIVTSVPS